MIAGFAGATADAFTLFERLEAKLEQLSGPADARLRRARQGLAHRPLSAPARGDDDRRRHATSSLVLTGTGDVLEPDDGADRHRLGRQYALAAARALIDMRRHRRRGDRPQGHGDRRRHLRLHQRQRHRRNHRPTIATEQHRADDLLPARDRLRARPLHRRPERRQARRRHRAAQPLAPPAARPATCARRCCPRTS